MSLILIGVVSVKSALKGSSQEGWIVTSGEESSEELAKIVLLVRMPGD